MFNNKRIKELERQVDSLEKQAKQSDYDIRQNREKRSEADRKMLKIGRDADYGRIAYKVIWVLLRHLDIQITQETADYRVVSKELKAADSAVEELSPCSALLEMITNPSVLTKILVVGPELQQRGGEELAIGEFLLAAARLEKRFASGELK